MTGTKRSFREDSISDTSSPVSMKRRVGGRITSPDTDANDRDPMITHSTHSAVDVSRYRRIENPIKAENPIVMKAEARNYGEADHTLQDRESSQLGFKRRKDPTVIDSVHASEDNGSIPSSPSNSSSSSESSMKILRPRTSAGHGMSDTPTMTLQEVSWSLQASRGHADAIREYRNLHPGC